MKKDSSKMLQELQGCEEFSKFYRENQERMLTQVPLSQLLKELLDKHGIKKADAIRRSELSEIYAYQIFAGSRVPDRKKVLALAVGLGINLDEVQELLKRAGYAPLYVKNTFDCIVTFGICKGLSVAQINELLFDYDLETLG